MGLVDTVIYAFLPWWTTVLLRLLQRRSWLHRVSGRSILIGDVPWVAQSVEAFASKLFALSYSIASASFYSANPADHLVHRHTHRVVRGGLLLVGRPDGRLNTLTTTEAAVCLSINQASSIQNFGVTCESVTIGHNPYKLPLSAGAILLPTVRPQFICEVMLSKTPDPTPGNSAHGGSKHGGSKHGGLEHIPLSTEKLHEVSARKRIRYVEYRAVCCRGGYAARDECEMECGE